ncbi:MAG: extracellular solute-binding protein [Oscillospiraceae bacterium]|nr:extracellular solute-binding protein [Oscillospiraceae bacterium]
MKKLPAAMHKTAIAMNETATTKHKSAIAMQKSAILLMAAVACAALLFGCDSGRNATLTVWCAEMDREVVTAMVNDFMAAKPAIKGVNVEICEDDHTREKFEGDPAAAADVICIPHDQLGALASQGYLHEISGGAHVGAINENTAASVKAGQFDGKQYGFPSSFETHMLFYDKTIISDAAARTLEGIVGSGTGSGAGGSAGGAGSGAGALPEDGAILFGMDFANAYFTANWFYTYGCLLFGENGEDSSFCDFDSAGGIAAMTYLIENRELFGNMNGELAQELFAQRRLGAYIGGPWNAAAFTEALKGNYGCAMLPSVDGREMRSFAGIKLYCVNANTKNKDVAMDLAAWLTSPDNQKARFQARNLVPVSLSLADDIDVAVSTTAKAVMAQGANAVPMPSISEMSNFWDPTGDFTLACYMGEVDISDLPRELSKLAATIKGTSQAP